MRFRRCRLRKNPGGVRRVVIVGGVLLLAGCGGEQSTLAPESGPAPRIETMWWVLLILPAIVVGVVTLLVLAAVLRRRGRLDRVEGGRSGRTFVLVSGAVIPAVVLIALFVYVLSPLDATAQPTGRAELNIEVVGKQWWWADPLPGAADHVGERDPYSGGRLGCCGLLCRLGRPCLPVVRHTVRRSDLVLAVQLRSAGRSSCSSSCGVC